MITVPILLYHAISPEPPPLIRPFTETSEIFAAHMDCIVERGKVSLTVSDFAAAFGAPRRFPNILS